MGSGSAYESARGSYYEEPKDEKAKESYVKERKARIEKTRDEVKSGHVHKEEVRDTRNLYDRSLVTKVITRPSTSAKIAVIVGIDNSGSNRTIADHVKSSSGYIIASLEAIVSSEVNLAFMFFSDHCDGQELWNQEIDYITPSEQGDRALYSSMQHIKNAGGGDPPEAIECLFKRASELEFPASVKKIFVLITDQVAHGMMSDVGDDGCPYQVSWKKSLNDLRKNFDHFYMIGCGDDQNICQQQLRFFENANAKFDFMSLADVKKASHRMKLTPTALIFLIAREKGQQAVKSLLCTLYEKWLSNTSEFGSDADLSARRAIARFTKFLNWRREDIKSLLVHVLDLNGLEEAEKLMKEINFMQ